MLYFAYGSNMALTQMASRCPSSTFEGKGRLLGYRWQINERGVGNIIESHGDYVEGIVYEIDRDSRRQLDRNEGVGRGYYKAENFPIQFTPLQDHGFKTGYVARKLDTTTIPRQDTEEERSGGQTCPQGHATSSPSISQPSTKISHHDNVEASDFVIPQGKGPAPYVDPTAGAASENARADPPQTVDVLVYISTNYKTDGKIRTEYIPRMEKAILDAQKLGLSRHFLKQIEDCIHRPYLPPQQSQITQESHCEAQNLQGHTGTSLLQQGDSIREQQDGTHEDGSVLHDPARTARV